MCKPSCETHTGSLLHTSNRHWRCASLYHAIISVEVTQSWLEQRAREILLLSVTCVCLQDALSSWRLALQSGFAAASAQDKRENDPGRQPLQLPFMFGSASYLEDAAGGLEHPDWSASAPQHQPSEAASVASPPSEQEEDPSPVIDQESENHAKPAEEADGTSDFRSMLDAVLQARPG